MFNIPNYVFDSVCKQNQAFIGSKKLRLLVSSNIISGGCSRMHLLLLDEQINIDLGSS